MKRILISTITDYNNYGNRLQNYALQHTLEKFNFQVESMRNTPFPERRSDRFKFYLKNYPRNKLFNLVLNFIKQKKMTDEENNRMNKLDKIREENFMKFTLNNINETKFEVTNDSTDVVPVENYDYFITGSDQVWNPNFRYGLSIDFLRFAPQSKRIAYAPSIGINKIPEKHSKNYTNWIDEIPQLSVREDQGAKIIKELTGRNPQVLVDPTLLLEKNDWLEVAKESPHKPLKNYLLTYFLEEITEPQLQYIESIAEMRDLEIVNLAKPEFAEYYTAGPSEFLDYINSCDIFLTNSFHGVVFSILFKKPFIVFKRGNMNSRINTLLEKFRLNGREAEKVNKQEVFDIDYTHIQAILDEERGKSFAFLKNAVGFAK